MIQFDYESKIWGGTKVRASPFYLGASRLEFGLAELKHIQGRVLEVGCGAGGMAKAIKFYRPDLAVFGIDISKKAISKAKQNPQGVKFSQADAYQLPFKEKSLEAVLMFDFLEHLDDPQKALVEARRVLKPKGILIAFIPLEGSLFSIHGLARKFFHFSPKMKYAGHVQAYTFSEFETLLRKAGLKLLRKRYFGHLFNQLVDFGYFTFLSFRGRGLPYSVEEYLAREQGWKRNLVALTKSMIAALSYFESRLFWFFPGSGVHLTAGRSL